MYSQWNILKVGVHKNFELFIPQIPPSIDIFNVYKIPIMFNSAYRHYNNSVERKENLRGHKK